ncbi:MAG: IclR family transcriptional regulator [Mesorhizobium sp.]|uniref:IclR family transcriptional regulator n=1 Tax=Mesorhizobium sp. TaxID=1871066 RepID=UPI00122AA3B6|nr:IclR family transcriptional regulator [Mesorhizobium sp.]TIR27821.1 MAG: IclR family transcriptional regulator [Mesorhizobium sp.]
MSEADIAEARNGIQVIARAASVLRALKGSQTGMSLGQIAERVDLPRSTVQRIVGALQAERLVIASGAGAGIRLGPELHSLAESAHYNIAETIRPLLQDLSRNTGETVDLSILRGNILIFIDQITGTQRLRAVSSVGETFPLTTTANGKACLALMDNDAVERLARGEWARASVERNMSNFLEEIAQIRREGVAFDLDEHTPGISAVGIAFKDWKGDFYGVSIPTPSARFKEGEATLTAAILKLRCNVEALTSG